MYNFGQFRKTQLNSYMTPISFTLDDLQTPSITSSEVIFLDKKITLNENLKNQENNQLKSYYLRIKIYKLLDSEQKITIKLVNTNKTEDNTQQIDEIEIEAGDINQYYIYETVITPNNIYNEIHFILNRKIEDYMTKDEHNFYGRKMNITVERLTDVYNIINEINPLIENKGRLKQIGVQSRPGLLMDIQGEGIKVGRSGLYEINNGVSIDFLGFIIDNDDNNTYFVLDYQY